MTHLIVTSATEEELRSTESVLTLKSGLCIVLSSVCKDMAESWPNVSGAELAGLVAQALFAFEVASESNLSMHNYNSMDWTSLYSQKLLVSFSTYANIIHLTLLLFKVQKALQSLKNTFIVLWRCVARQLLYIKVNHTQKGLFLCLHCKKWSDQIPTFTILMYKTVEMNSRLKTFTKE